MNWIKCHHQVRQYGINQCSGCSVLGLNTTLLYLWTLSMTVATTAWHWNEMPSPGWYYDNIVFHKLLSFSPSSMHACRLYVLLALLLLQPFYGPLDFVRDYPGEPAPEKYNQNQSGFPGARDSEWQWDQLGHMQICTSLQTDNHASTHQPLSFYRSDALLAAHPTASKHWRLVLIPFFFLNKIWAKLSRDSLDRFSPNVSP